MVFYIRRKFDGGNPDDWADIGPYETREEAEQDAAPFVGRPGWTVEIVEKDEPFYRDFI